MKVPRKIQKRPFTKPTAKPYSLLLEMASEVEENVTLLNLEGDNASNLTGRGAATPLGIAVTYSSLFLMALGPILLGSFRSVSYHSVMKVK